MTLPFFSDKPKVRTLLQSEQEECGLACMAMIANAYGHNVDLPYMRSIHRIYRGGMSLAELYNLAGQFGLSARGLGIQNIDDLDGLRLPAILHWEGRHYVVLEAIKGGKYIIQDPAVGRRTYNRADFTKHFSGVALEFEVPVDVEKITSKGGGISLWEILKSTTGFKASFWKIMAVSIAIGILALATPILLQVALDFVIPQADIDLLGVLAIGLCALLLFEQVANWLRNMVILRTSLGMQVQFSRSVVSHGLRLPLRHFESRHAGDFITRLNSVDQVKAFAADGMIRSFADAAVSILAVALMFYYSVQMTFMVLFTLVLAVVARTAYMRRTREATTESLSAKAEEVSTLLDGLDRIQIIKAHNISSRIEKRWFEKMARFAGRDFNSRRLQIDNELVVSALVVFGTIATLYFGVVAVLANKMTIGMLYAFFALRSSFFQMADTLTENLMHLTVVSSHVQRLEDVIQAEPEQNSKAAVIRRAIRKSVEVKDVMIRFGREDRTVITSANLKINVENGERVAIIGESGSGKSSLLKVMASIAQPTSGAVLIDGQSLSRFGVMEYRANIGAVFAEDGLFTATVAENVSLFDPEIPMDRIRDALSLVGLDDEIEALPQGLATIVSNNNSLLSTGQRRRVLAARVICRQPRLMLFDEITANLDSKTEHALLECLCKLPGGKVFVTHSDRLLDYVDRAYRLENGVLSLVEPDRPAPEEKSGAPIVEQAVAEPEASVPMRQHEEADTAAHFARTSSDALAALANASVNEVEQPLRAAAQNAPEMVQMAAFAHDATAQYDATTDHAADVEHHEEPTRPEWAAHFVVPQPAASEPVAEPSAPDASAYETEAEGREPHLAHHRIEQQHSESNVSDIARERVARAMAKRQQIRVVSNQSDDNSRYT